MTLLKSLRGSRLLAFKHDNRAKEQRMWNRTQALTL
jgi:hypothetical protein